MAFRIKQACAATGWGMLVLFFAGFFLSGFISPPDPQASPQEIARMFDDDRTAIRVGLYLASIGAALLVPWGVAFFQQLRRAAGRRSPLPWVMLLSCTLFSLEFLYLLFFWQVAAFREDQSPEIVRMLNDLAWVPFVALVSTAVVMVGALAVSMLSDRRTDPVFPRWLGYFNLWTTFMFTPGSFCVFFKDGPFAYNGLLAWYMPVTVFGIFLILNMVYLLRAVGREHEQEPPESFDPAGAPLEIEDVARELAELRRELDRVREPVGAAR